MILYNRHVVHVDSKEIYVQAIAAKKAMHCAGSPGVEVPTPRCLALALLWSDLNRRWAPAPMPRPRHFPWKRGWAPRLESLFTVKTEFLMPWIAMNCHDMIHMPHMSSEICEQPFLPVAMRRPSSWMKCVEEWALLYLYLFIGVYCSDCKKRHRLSSIVAWFVSQLGICLIPLL